MLAVWPRESSLFFPAPLLHLPGKNARCKFPLTATPDCPNCPFRHDTFSPGCTTYLRQRSVVVAVRSTDCSWEQARATARNPARAATTQISRNHQTSARPPQNNAWNVPPTPGLAPTDFPALPNAQQHAKAQLEAAHPPRKSAETQTERTELDPSPARGQQCQERQKPPQQQQPPRNPAAPSNKVLRQNISDNG
ncbi:hypothetical protein ISCGN_011262 [Ixodes scapularis]